MLKITFIHKNYMVLFYIFISAILLAVPKLAIADTKSTIQLNQYSTVNIKNKLSQALTRLFSSKTVPVTLLQTKTRTLHSAGSKPNPKHLKNGEANIYSYKFGKISVSAITGNNNLLVAYSDHDCVNPGMLSVKLYGPFIEDGTTIGLCISQYPVSSVKVLEAGGNYYVAYAETNGDIHVIFKQFGAANAPWQQLGSTLNSNSAVINLGFAVDGDGFLYLAANYGSRSGYGFGHIKTYINTSLKDWEEIAPPANHFIGLNLNGNFYYQFDAEGKLFLAYRDYNYKPQIYQLDTTNLLTTGKMEWNKFAELDLSKYGILLSTSNYSSFSFAISDNTLYLLATTMPPNHPESSTLQLFQGTAIKTENSAITHIWTKIDTQPIFTRQEPIARINAELAIDGCGNVSTYYNKVPFSYFNKNNKYNSQLSDVFQPLLVNPRTSPQELEYSYTVAYNAVTNQNGVPPYIVGFSNTQKCPINLHSLYIYQIQPNGNIFESYPYAIYKTSMDSYK